MSFTQKSMGPEFIRVHGIIQVHRDKYHIFSLMQISIMIWRMEDIKEDRGDQGLGEKERKGG